jgi:predicted ATPase
MEQAMQRAEELGHAASSANALFLKTHLESRRGDVAATRLASDGLLASMEEHGMKHLGALGQALSIWARGRLLDPEAGANGLRQALAAHMAGGNRGGTPWIYGLLAELESAARGPDSALAHIETGLAIAEETGEHWNDAFMHRLRGNILLKRDPADPSSAEEAFRTSIAIAKEQGARSPVLLASLALAKVLQSTAHPVDAHAVLAPALEGFSPTPEMPEIAEAQALLAEVAQ